ncbi:AraC family transcriptional regulator [Actinoalloteichus hymeniacidonis]|uniref:DNA-binding domain-containing protein, AraC-type n=1 Tax=Actinoalloteichus hymeniacidonis TaxID=340345 RepID=A0AAC9MWT0_9PSEU|nr:AraC family transcriptional regulator [Actinoalloteichus hymeniacidonis]AOS61635.1 DNA-binding domain-containing protein, AraC-type [Actinoalloteichus hymeniacidonis]MBB5910352.1 AraC family transcriptional regulator [Actinoalloteichus hymeniacidonis]
MELWNRAMDVIEEHLEQDEIDMRQVAAAALTSEYQLRRVFSVLAGMPLSEYIRRRRMTVAARAVRAGQESVQDIAVRFGYNSADAFARAFRGVHGVGPEQARRPEAILRSQPRLSFHLTVQGRTDMKYRIVEKPAFRIVGRRTRARIIFEGGNSELDQFVLALPDSDWERIEELSDQEPAGALSVWYDADGTGGAEGTEAEFYLGAATNQPAPPGYDSLEIGAHTWAAFTASGPFPESLEKLWRSVGGEWLPANPYRLVPVPQLVRADYHDDEGTHADVELWLAVEPTD